MRVLKLGCGVAIAIIAGLFVLIVLVAILGPKQSSSNFYAEKPTDTSDSNRQVQVNPEATEKQLAPQSQTKIADISPQQANPNAQEAEKPSSADDYPDLYITLSKAYAGQQEIDALRGSYVQGNEAFQVDSVIDGFVIYQLRPDLQSMTGNQPYRVALIREPHKSYLTGSLMPRGLYLFRGTQEFISALGGHEMLPVIER